MTRRSLNILSVLVVGVCMLALTAAAPAGGPPAAEGARPAPPWVGAGAAPSSRST